MLDSYGRNIDYMRVSVTDRCNLRCKYCMPEDLPFINHDNILRYEEILRLCAAAAKTGIRTVRVTGGEPLIRKGCVGFLRELKLIPGIEHVTLTTNGILLEQYIDELAELGLGGLNISMDSTDAGTYLKITGKDHLPSVLRSLHKAVESGLRVKINCVPVKGLNENDILSMAGLAESMPVDVRFIELMPTSAGETFEGITGAEILDRLLGEYPDLTLDTARHGFGPARYYKSSRIRGGVGIIDAVSNHFCSGCNRVRLTSEGFLKLCLYHGDGLDLRKMLRNGADDAMIEAAIAEAVYAKPERHLFGGGSNAGDGIGKMSRIGG